MFKLHPDNKITITQGDDAELDLRLFNKDSIMPRLPREIYIPDKEYPLLNGKGQILFRDIEVQEIDSEGNPVWDEDSEGNKTPHWIINQVPVYPHDMPLYDSEGREVIAWFPTPEGLHRFGDWHLLDPKPSMFPNRFPFKYPSGYHQLQEEFILGKISLRVRDFEGNLVLEAFNDEFPNTIFLDRELTEELEPKLYFYQLEYDDGEEVQTIQDTTFFEVVKHF